MIDTAFFRTKQFVIAAAIAILILGAAAATYTVNGLTAGWASSEGCHVEMAGEPIATEPAVVVDADGRHRTVTYSFDAAGLDGGRLAACSRVGEILVEPSLDGRAHVELRIRGESADAVAATEVRAVFSRLDGGLGVAAWHQVVGEEKGMFGSRHVEITTLVRLPATGAFDVSLASEVGDLRVTDLLVGNLTLQSDVGDVRALDVDAQGDVSARSDVGDVILSLRSVQSGVLDAASDVGDIEVALPLRADVGYAVTAQSDVGETEVRIGETETHTSEEDGVGGRVEARSRDYDSKPTKVQVHASSDVGDVGVTAN